MYIRAIANFVIHFSRCKMGMEIVPLLTAGNFVWSDTTGNFDTPFLRKWNKGIWKMVQKDRWFYYRKKKKKIKEKEKPSLAPFKIWKLNHN